MEVVDLRPSLERWFADRPAPPAAARGAGGPVGRLAASLADRLVSRRVRRRSAPPADALVVSVGNLRVGGTGKTPVVGALAAALAQQGVAGAVLTRGHGGSARGPVAVCRHDPSGGDEARLLAGRLREHGWLVVQARDRGAGLLWLRRHEPGRQVILLEDAFQTAAVGRHVDVLILDSWETSAEGVVVPRTGAVLPLGPYRETARGSARAAVWLLEQAGPMPAGPPGVTVCGFTRRSWLVAEVGAGPGEGPVALLSGLARPGRFEADATRLAPGTPVLAVRTRDHAGYDGDAVGRILAAGRSRGVAGWITTEKDWVKLAGLWPADVPLAVVRQDVVWGQTPALPDVVRERLAVLGAGRGRTERR